MCVYVCVKEDGWWQQEEEERRCRERLLCGRGVDLFVWIMCLLNKSYHLGSPWTRQTCLNRECQSRHLWHPLLFFFFLSLLLFRNFSYTRGNFDQEFQNKKTKNKKCCLPSQEMCMRACGLFVCTTISHRRDWRVGGWGCLGDAEIQNALHSGANGEAERTLHLHLFSPRVQARSTLCHCCHFCPTIFNSPLHAASPVSYLSTFYLSDTSYSSVTCLHISLSLA